jgi:hypothetical protein
MDSVPEEDDDLSMYEWRIQGTKTYSFAGQRRRFPVVRMVDSFPEGVLDGWRKTMIYGCAGGGLNVGKM